LSVITAALGNEDVAQARREAAAQIALYASPKTYERPLAVAGFARESAEIRDALARRDFGAMSIAALTDATAPGYGED
jgi:dihydroorotate dehydrogenase